MAPNESTRLSRPNGQGQASQAQEPALPDQVQETQFTEPVEQGQDGQHVAVQVQRQGYGTISGNSPSSVSAVSPVRGASSGRVLSPDLLRGLLMILQSIDHASIFLAAWQHGVGKRPEADGGIVTEWNAGRAWFARMATHLCAPGFMFLLGMGVVYFGRSVSLVMRFVGVVWSGAAHCFRFALTLGFPNEQRIAHCPRLVERQTLTPLHHPRLRHRPSQLCNQLAQCNHYAHLLFQRGPHRSRLQFRAHGRVVDRDAAD